VSLDLFEMVARRELTPEEAVDIMMLERQLSTPLWVCFLQWTFDVVQGLLP
jgi:hypothetical protein